MQIVLQKLMTWDPSMNWTAHDVVDEVGKKLGRTFKQLKPMLKDVSAQYKRTLAALLKPAPMAEPVEYQRLGTGVPWHTIPALHRAITDLCEALHRDYIREEFILRYMDHMARATAASAPPQVPSIAQLGYGGLVYICKAVKVQPPDDCNQIELENARKRLSEITGQTQFILSKKLCSLARDDLHWLSYHESMVAGRQTVLGPGSVVTHSADIRAPMVILRPEVWHNYDQTTQTLQREVAYTGTDYKDIRASTIIKTLTKTEWPLSGTAVNFEWNGPESPFYLNGRDMRDQAEKWGIHFDDTTSHERLQRRIY